MSEPGSRYKAQIQNHLTQSSLTHLMLSGLQLEVSFVFLMELNWFCSDGSALKQPGFCFPDEHLSAA